MKAIINNAFTVKMCDSARISQVSSTLTFIRVKKGEFSDIELVRAAALGHFELDSQGDDWRLVIKTELIKWED